MAYRKITVDGTVYEYVVGKQYLKIKGLGSWPRDKIGIEIERKRDKYAVTPDIIADLIQGVKLLGKE